MKGTACRRRQHMLEALESRVLLSAASWRYEAAGVPVAALGDTAIEAGGTQGTGATATISAPANLMGSAPGPHAVYLNWSASSSGVLGFRVFRNGSLYDTINDAGARSYADLSADPGTAYSYHVAAYNNRNEVSGASNTVTVATRADDTVMPGEGLQVTARFGGTELVVAGSVGADSVHVWQEEGGAIVINGAAYDAPANGLFVYSFGGADCITVDASVTLRLTIAAIDGAGATITNHAANAGIWVDADDYVTAESVGSVHRVGEYLGGISKDAGIAITDPKDAGTTFRISASLWGGGPVAEDVNQGDPADCYYLASLAAFAGAWPGKLQDMAVDLGDGTYAVEYRAENGLPVYVRVDGEMSLGTHGGYANAHPRDSGAVWALVMEKAYAYYRTGARTYASLWYGYSGDVYGDLGAGHRDEVIGLDFFDTVSAALAAGNPVTLLTYTTGTTLISNHVYTLVEVHRAYSRSGLLTEYYRVRNPWGVEGSSLEDGEGVALLTYRQLLDNFRLGTVGTA